MPGFRPLPPFLRLSAAVLYLTDNYGSDPEVTGMVDAYQIWLVATVNPDGLARVHEVDDSWRKNTRDNDGDGTTDFLDGVDLNRNYEWGWGYQCQGSSGSFSSETYRGASEASEPEAQAMIALGRRIRPVFDLEYHAYGEDVLYALSCDPQFSPTLSTIVVGPGEPDQEISRVIAEEYASRIVQADGGLGFSAWSYGSQVDGTGRDQQYHENGAIAFVTEINSYGEGGFWPDYLSWRDSTVEGQRPGWLWLIERMSGPAVGGHVSDGLTGLPVEAEVALDQMGLPDGKRLTSRPDTGRFHLIVVPGDYTLRVRAPGYREAVIPVSVGDTFVPTEVALEPLGSSLILREDFEDPGRAALWTVGDPEDTAGPNDHLEAEVSSDGATWISLERLETSTSTPDAMPAWTAAGVRLDDLLAPGPEIRFRFRAVDLPPEHVVEAALDDLELRGYSLEIQGEVVGVTVAGGASTVLSWDPVPGGEGAVYDVVRGELLALSEGTGGTELGALACIEESSPDTSTSGDPDLEAPAPPGNRRGGKGSAIMPSARGRRPSGCRPGSRRSPSC